MNTIGLDGWGKYGWGKTYTSEWCPLATLNFDFSFADRPIKNVPALTAAHEAICQIVNSNPGPITLMCSGGVDSQAMLWALHTSGVEFRVVSVRYRIGKSYFNDHDLNTLIEFTTRYNIPVTFHDFDIQDFLENGELTTVSKKYDCSSPQICTYIKMTSSIPEGIILFSGNFISTDLGKPGASLNYTILGLQRWADSITLPRKIIPFFFLSTPTLAYAFRANNAGYKSKIAAYKDMGFPIIPQKTKFSGFELVKEYYDTSDMHILPHEEKYASLRASQRKFDILFRYRLESNSSIDYSNMVYKLSNSI